MNKKHGIWFYILMIFFFPISIFYFLYKLIVSIQKPTCNTSLHTPIHNKINAQKASSSAPPAHDEIVSDFNIDFVNIDRETHEGVHVHFNENEAQYIYIDNEAFYFNCRDIRYHGLSSDKKYYRISTCDFYFWVLPEDYVDFSKALNRAKARLAIYDKEREKKALAALNETKKLLTPITPDAVTDDCIFCFVVSPNDAERYVTNAPIIIDEISSICDSHDGRLFKTEAKTAKCAILLSPSSRSEESYKRYREKGYIAVTAEDFLSYFGINDIYDRSMAKVDCERYVKSIEESMQHILQK